MEKYKSYSLESFLQDEDFIRWQLFSDEEDETYWNEVIQTYPLLADTIREASIQFKNTVKLRSRELDPQSVDAGVAALLEKLSTIKHRKKAKSMFAPISIAASFALILVSSWFLFNSKEVLPDVPAELSFVKMMPNDDVVLVMGDSSIILENNAQVRLDNKRMMIVDPKSNIVKNEEFTDKCAMNKLIVPYGKRSSVVLSDGSKVWVNAGTTVEYPNTFTGDTRSIKVDGEIYIEVAKSKEKQFIVATSEFDVKVYGTVFDVSAYSEDKNNYVVLVEGKVTVDDNGTETGLQPNDLYKSVDGVPIVEQVNVDDFVSWRHGWLSIKSFSLAEVALQLSRYYNVNIKCEPEIANLKASGKLRLFDQIDDVLHVVSNNMKIEYKQVDNAILLYRPKK